MRTVLVKLLSSAVGVALLAGSGGLIGVLGVDVATNGTASAATVTALYKCATPLGTKSVATTITTLNHTTPKSVPKGSDYKAKPQLKATIPAALIQTAATATKTLTSLPVGAATLAVAKVNFSGPGFFLGTPKPTKTTLLTIVPINTTTKAHGYLATITYTAETFTVTVTSGTATLTPTTLTLDVVVALKCFTPTHSIHYAKLPPPTTTSTNFSTYTVTGSNTLSPIDITTATPAVSGPTITKVTPSAGPIAGGTPVTLTGTGFVSAATTVTFGGTTIHATAVTFVSATKIKVTSPPHAAGQVTVKAHTAGGTSASGSHFTYEALPTISKVTPSAGPITGATVVTLTGSGFVSGATTVTFGGTPAMGSVQFVSTTQIKVGAPPHAAGQVTVKATTAGGTSASGSHFTYEAAPTITKVTPSAGPIAGGTTVTLTGSGFVSGATTVLFGGTTIHATAVTFVSTTQIKVNSPSHAAGQVTVKATTAGGTSAAGKHFTYVNGPTISKVTPGAGPVTGATVVTLTGTGFVSGSTSVTFGGTTIHATAVTFVSTTQIKVGSPPHAAGQVTVKATTPAGTSPSGTHFIYGAPTITKVTPSAGPTAGTTMVTLTGSGFVSGATSVTFGGTIIGTGSVTFVSSSQIKVSSPAHAAGQVTVKAITNGGTSLASHFTYLAAPTVTKVTPSVGPTAGTTMVTLTGSGFVSGATKVTFGGTTIHATAVTFVSTTQIKVSSPAHAAGTVTVKATTAGGTSASGEHFTYEAVPTISKVTPSAGPIAGTTAVTLTGTGFVSGATSVTFGGTTIHATAVMFVSTTQIKVTSPAHAAGQVTVKATTAGGTSASGSHFTYEAVPTITKVTPSAGPIAGATTVTLTGSGFVSGATKVTFGGTTIHATAVTFVSTSEVKVTSPAHAVGQVTVKATTAGGTSAPGSHFTYLAAPTITKVAPVVGPTAGGTPVTLTGTGFVSGATKVTFGGTTIHVTAVTFVSTTQIKVTSPAHAAGTVTVKAVTAGGTSGPGEHFLYGAPTITKVTPPAGPTSGGTLVTLTGTGFISAATSVTFGGTTIHATAVTFVSSTQIKVTSPAHGAGQVTVKAKTGGGTSASGSHFTYVAAPSITSVTPTQGPAAGGTTVTITGAGFTTVSAVFFGTDTVISITSKSPTRLTVKDPPGTPGPMDVTVTAAGGTVTATTAFTYLPAPTVTKVSPTQGPAAGGTTVTITGTNLTTVTSVKFGTVSATSLKQKSATQVSAVDPAGTPGTVSVSVTTIGGSATLAAAFAYIGASAPSATTKGYWALSADGGVFGFGTATFHGSATGKSPTSPVVGGAADATAAGYWVVTASGNVFNFGAAQLYGSEAGKALNGPIVGMAAAPTGHGYWLVGSDGGVYSFGAAQFYGSEVGKGLNGPIVGIAAAPTGHGYWLVGCDGGVFSFGTALFHGSESGKHLNGPVVGIASAATGAGYWLTASDGGVFSFGTAQFYGSEGGAHLNGRVTGIEPAVTGKGYWLVAVDGGVFSFGTAGFRGSAATLHLNGPVVGMVAVSS